MEKTLALRHLQSSTQIRTNKVWFEDRLRERDISQRKLARLMNMDASAVSLMLSGKRKMSAVEAGDVARLLGVTVEEVLRHAGVSVPVNAEKSVPIIGWVGERHEIHFSRPKGPQTVVAPPDVPSGCQALRVQSKGPIDGWVMFYRPIEGVSLEAVGRICIVKLIDEDAVYLKLVQRGYESGWHVLTNVTFQGGEQTHARLESASPVLWMKQ